MLTRKEFIRRVALGSAVAPLLVQQLGCSPETSQPTATGNSPAAPDSAHLAGRPGPPPGGPGGPPPGYGEPGGPPPMPPHHASKPGPVGHAADGSTCASTPELTGGPYPYDLSGNGAMTRRVIHERRPGLPFAFTFTVVNTRQGCAAIPDARIDVWHCDADGYYSEYKEPGYLGTRDFAGQTFCRGIQRTDRHGQVTFESIYPGWYQGRVTHVHFEVYVGRKKVLTSQLALPDSINAAVYARAPYARHGANSTVKNNAADMIFNETPAALAQALFHVVPNPATGGYTGSYTIGVPV